MHPLQIAIEALATAVEAEEHSTDFAIWAVAALANRLGLVVVVAPGGDELEAITEVGTAFVDMVVERLDEEPDQRAVMAVVSRVVQRVADEVRRSGQVTDVSCRHRGSERHRRRRIGQSESGAALMGRF